MNDVVIIGAGPAGITAAIQLKRYGFAPVLLERGRLGGLLWNANLVENYPGFPNGIPGPKLVARFEHQMRRIGVSVTHGEVIGLDFDGENFHVETHQNVYQARYAVIASGTKPKPIPLEIPAAARDKIFSEVYPLLTQRGRHVVIVGAGDAAFDYAMNLVRHNSVTILNRATTIKCLPLLWERAQGQAAITYRDGIEIVRIAAISDSSGLRVESVQRDTATHIECDYLLFATGREPDLDFFSSQFRKKEQMLIETGRLYFIGDVKNNIFRQTAIAAGDGLRAAMQIYAHLHGEEE